MAASQFHCTNAALLVEAYNHEYEPNRASSSAADACPSSLTHLAQVNTEAQLVAALGKCGTRRAALRSASDCHVSSLTHLAQVYTEAQLVAALDSVQTTMPSNMCHP